MLGLRTAIVCCVALLLAPSALRAAEPSPVWKDGWTINVPGASNWVSEGTPSPFSPSTYLQATPSMPFGVGAAKDAYGFADYSVGHTLGIGHEYGLGNIQATLGVRLANSVLPNYASSGSVLNIDGLLGLSYWFDTASKLTLGYHADYFKGSTALNMTGVPAENADRVNHGPMIRFSIQK